MPTCVIKSCKNNSTKKKKCQGITFHQFPRNSYRKDDWVQIIRICRGENDWNPSSASTVCSTHFDEVDFRTTAKGYRCLSPYAVPKRLLSNCPRIQTSNTPPPIVKILPKIRRIATDQQTTSSPSTISSTLKVDKPFELSGYCRLCAASDCNNKLLNVRSDNDLKKLVVKMLNRLNTNIDFNQEYLPATICLVCAKTLYTAYDFVVGIHSAQVTLQNLLDTASMQTYKYQTPENRNIGNNMGLSSTPLQQVSPKIDGETSKFEQSLAFVPNMTIPIPPVSPKIEAATNNCEQSSCSTDETLVTPKIEAVTSDFEESLSFVPSMATRVTPVYELDSPVCVAIEYQPEGDKPSLLSAKIEATTSNFKQSLPFASNMTIPSPSVSPNIGSVARNVEQPALPEPCSIDPLLLDSPIKRSLKYDIDKKRKLIDGQKKKIKILNQKIRRLHNRNESLKNKLKKMKK